MAKKNTKFEVIHDFRDLEDKNKTYRVGDSYPSPANKKISDERLIQLSSKSNRLGLAVIQEVTEAKEETK